VNLCVIEGCREHIDDDTWVHYAPKRDVPVTAHLRPQLREVA